MYPFLRPRLWRPNKVPPLWPKAWATKNKINTSLIKSPPPGPIFCQNRGPGEAHYFGGFICFGSSTQGKCHCPHKIFFWGTISPILHHVCHILLLLLNHNFVVDTTPSSQFFFSPYLGPPRCCFETTMHTHRIKNRRTGGEQVRWWGFQLWLSKPPIVCVFRRDPLP